jgi:hypothetical protein
VKDKDRASTTLRPERANAWQDANELYKTKTSDQR